MIFLPVTRTFSLDAVVEALDASDCPKSIFLYLDAPYMQCWVEAFEERGWTVVYYDSGRRTPPSDDTLNNRMNHVLMRQLSQRLLMQHTYPQTRLLCVEDDTIVPPDVWSSLDALLNEGYTAASGVQRDRRGTGLLGVWHYDTDSDCYDPMFIPSDHVVIEADSVGHYCLMTTVETYVTTPIETRDDVPVDRQHTAQMAPIAVDTGVWCGHLTDKGDIIV